MKKLLSGFIAALLIVLTLCAPSTVFASDFNDDQSIGNDLSDIASLFTTLRISGVLQKNDANLLYLNNNDYENHPAYSQLLIVIEYINFGIAEGIIAVNDNCSIVATSGITDISTYSLSDLQAEYTPKYLTAPPSQTNCSTYAVGGNIILPTPPPDSWEVHTCTEEFVDILTICEENYKFLATYYESMLVVQMSEPTFNAWLSTVSFWISHVRSNGAWDYKVSAQYGPYNNELCTYYNDAYRHITAEYFGNLNYGYTGSLLFSLDMLHTGSYVVSGFDPADEEDWPAIDTGYNLKVN